jgi:hypothetical protein
MTGKLNPQRGSMERIEATLGICDEGLMWFSLMPLH